ncbi:hypothetical protein NDU88_007752 [Pleurodeles waltl]|uniref:Uncharacterized protein n=1 Tax=Pleurodeles waltl TaxID=8319 RepID=A0AAV7RQB9_PLEWA|nr:hypothetical protein NDU88_007752 [Pleurodeles waltl]
MWITGTDARNEELDCHRRELLTLQGKNQELQYQLEDLENSSRCSNIRIAQAVTGALEGFVVHLFRHVAPALKEQNMCLTEHTELVALPTLQTYWVTSSKKATHHTPETITALDEDKVEYALFRTKQKFYAGGDTAAHLLVHRLRSQAVGRRVAELRMPDGTLTCQEELILQQIEQFYTDLYSTEERDDDGMEDYLDSTTLPRIPPWLAIS